MTIQESNQRLEKLNAQLTETPKGTPKYLENLNFLMDSCAIHHRRFGEYPNIK